ncbi:hypothetical protein D3C72_935280 [compost metagenome]
MPGSELIMAVRLRPTSPILPRTPPPARVSEMLVRLAWTVAPQGLSSPPKSSTTAALLVVLTGAPVLKTVWVMALWSVSTPAFKLTGPALKPSWVIRMFELMPPWKLKAPNEVSKAAPTSEPVRRSEASGPSAPRPTM